MRIKESILYGLIEFFFLLHFTTNSDHIWGTFFFFQDVEKMCEQKIEKISVLDLNKLLDNRILCKIKLHLYLG